VLADFERVAEYISFGSPPTPNPCRVGGGELSLRCGCGSTTIGKPGNCFRVCLFMTDDDARCLAGWIICLVWMPPTPNARAYDSSAVVDRPSTRALGEGDLSAASEGGKPLAASCAKRAAN
jgi:hypothetical protein